MSTFWIIHRSYLGVVLECRAKRKGRGWSVLTKLDDETWEYIEEIEGWQSLSKLKQKQFMVCARGDEPGMWPDGTISEPPFHLTDS
jgi:hypothetical protein